MAFFNKKTDVMDIELTPYGRYLLSIGRLKPAFYEFVDDDILYDASAGGVTETQEEAHDRITKNTPKLKTLYLKTGVETDSPENYLAAASNMSDFVYENYDPDSFNISIETIREELETVTHNQKGIYSLGRSYYSSEKTPNFQVTMLQGEISSSVNHLLVSSSAEGNIIDSLQIPQIDVELNVIAHTGSELVEPSENFDFTSKVFDDGTYVKLSLTEPMLHLKEFNSFYEKENFEIEVYKVSTTSLNNGNSVDVLQPLKYRKRYNPIQNDLLISDVDFDDQVPGDNAFYEEDGPTSDYVEYFFNIDFDDQIPVEELCQAVDKLEINSQFLDEELICPDKRTERFDIYSTRVDPSDLEDCD